MTQGKGGGPKTPEGKKRSSKNAVKHGLLMPHPALIEGPETEEEWDEFRHEIIESLAPVGRLEQEQAAILRYETGVINYDFHSAHDHAWIADAMYAPDKDAVPDPDPMRVAILQQQRVIPRGSGLDYLTRYETHIHRLLTQSLHEYEAMQARRRGEKTSLARISVTTPPRGSPGPQPRVDSMVSELRNDLGA